MIKKDDANFDRPHYFSQYWINIAREDAGMGAAPTAIIRPLAPVETDDPDQLPTQLTPSKKMMEDLDDFSFIPQPLPKKEKDKPMPLRKPTLNSLTDLASLSFGSGMEMEELAIGEDDNVDDVLPRLDFDLDEVEPMDDETASIETLTEEEFEDWDDEDDEFGNAKPKSPKRQDF